MAAITPDSEVQGGALARPYQGDRHEVYHFLSQGISNTDTWAVPGGTARIRTLAWEPVDSSDQVAALVLDATDVGFGASVGGAPHNGRLHVFIKG